MSQSSGPICQGKTFGSCPEGFVCQINDGKYRCVKSVDDSSIAIIITVSILVLILFIGFGLILSRIESDDKDYTWVMKESSRRCVV